MNLARDLNKAKVGIERLPLRVLLQGLNLGCPHAEPTKMVDRACNQPGPDTGTSDAGVNCEIGNMTDTRFGYWTRSDISHTRSIENRDKMVLLGRIEFSFYRRPLTRLPIGRRLKLQQPIRILIDADTVESFNRQLTNPRGVTRPIAPYLQAALFHHHCAESSRESRVRTHESIA